MIAKVIVSINARQIDKEFDYLIPDELLRDLHIGDMVKFPFGSSNKLKTGYVIDIVEKSNYSYTLKYLHSIIDNGINTSSKSIKIAKFIHDNYGSTMIQALKVVIPIKKKIKSRNNLIVDNEIPSNKKDIELVEEQKNIINNITSDINRGIANRYLIHGVTGSGKTQIFIELAKDVVKQGKKVIVLIPEISLTYQMVRRFLDNFGDRIGIIHSKLSAGERYQQIERAQNNEIDIMIGPRSALFTPFNDIGCIIIDEEHESSYKSEMTPRYDTREVAEYMSKEFSIPLVLASATPSIETYYKCEKKDYKLFTINSRIGTHLPEISIIDMREEVKNGNYNIFSQELLNNINKALNNNEQVMLFVNRRGYSNYISCLSCGNVIQCEHCDVSYTYHSDQNVLRCHYCGDVKNAPNKCPNCGSIHLDKYGYGTQKVEEELNRIFPDYKTIRMDQDTTSKKASYEKILSKFHRHEADILVGTQMIIKGHDFPEVALVGILNIDSIINISSYKSSEKAFQSIVQASGRAGRRNKRGKAIIQTYQPENYVITCAANNDYKGFYDLEMSYRSIMSYPPIKNLLKITISSYRFDILDIITNKLKNYIVALKKEGMTILGPSNERIFKLNDRYRKSIHIKGDDRVIKYFIKVCDYIIKNDEEFKICQITYEINADS